MHSYSPRTVLCGLACLVALAGGVAKAAHADAPPVDPKAKQLLDEVIKAYKGLTSYADQGKFVLNISENGKSKNQSSPLRLTFTRPNKLDFDAGLVRMVSDGKTITSSVEPLKQYRSTDAPAAITFETFRQGPAGSVVFGGPTGPPMLILLNLLLGEDPVKLIEELDGTLKVGPERKDGLSLLLDRKEGPDFELFIDPGTKLLSKINLVIAPEILAKTAVGGSKVTIDQFGWDAGTVSTKAPDADAFVFTPPADFKKVGSFESAGVEDPSESLQKYVGKPSPDFTLTVLDGDKTRTVSKADLAGKVVLLDFWATWCPPCIKALPELQQMIEGYAKDNKDVVIVALNQDEEPRELPELRKLIEKTLEEKKVVLTGTKVGLIAVDPTQVIGNAFSVQSIPTLFILDGKGIVQAAYVGQQTGGTLSKDIDALLAGKSLLKDKADAAATKKD
ncbi:redoxin domain-containing protein [Singulisphaera sp. Ch08]|uniref:Redoxin domain-containing protein n=1 Tax=Singulisphaera sp. Ch08 TaxID=3120278 RepID=A0AAU7C6R8_9BACT